MYQVKKYPRGCVCKKKKKKEAWKTLKRFRASCAMIPPYRGVGVVCYVQFIVSFLCYLGLHRLRGNYSFDVIYLISGLNLLNAFEMSQDIENPRGERGGCYDRSERLRRLLSKRSSTVFQWKIFVEVSILIIIKKKRAPKIVTPT